MNHTDSSTGSDPVVDQLRAAGCVFAEDEAVLLRAEAADAATLEKMINRRIAGVPLEQIVGWAEFCGQRFTVRPGVFVPRKRTELLVRTAADRCRPGETMVDLCSGVGAIAAAVLAMVSPLELYCTEIDPGAVSCARHNLGGRCQTGPTARRPGTLGAASAPDYLPRQAHLLQCTTAPTWTPLATAPFNTTLPAVRATVLNGDLFDPLPPALRGSVAMITANAPYVPTAEISFMPSEARDHELLAALDGGIDGLDLHRRIIDQAPTWLADGGWLLIETGREQADLDLELLAAAGFDGSTIIDDEIDGTVVAGQLARFASTVGSP